MLSLLHHLVLMHKSDTDSDLIHNTRPGPDSEPSRNRVRHGSFAESIECHSDAASMRTRSGSHQDRIEDQRSSHSESALLQYVADSEPIQEYPETFDGETSSQNTDPPQRKEKPSFDLLLIGKSGQGKSATANSIVQRNVFRTSSKRWKLRNKETKTCFPKAAWSETPDYIVKVIDGIQLEGRGNEEALRDRIAFLSMCEQGFDGLLFVHKVGDPFTREERESIAFYKRILGEDVFKRFGIVVLTGGDRFKRHMEEESTPNKTHLEWSLEQEIEFADFVRECDSRVVLFNNWSTDEKEMSNQVKEVLYIVQERVLKQSGSYTSEEFKIVSEEQKKSIKELNFPQLKEEAMRGRSLLEEAFHKLTVGTLAVSQNQLSCIRELMKQVCKLEHPGDESRLRGIEESFARLSKTEDMSYLRSSICGKNLRVIGDQMDHEMKQEKEVKFISSSFTTKAEMNTPLDATSKMFFRTISKCD